MRRSAATRLLAAGLVLALGAGAQASSLQVRFDREQAHPGDVVQLLISGDAETRVDAVVVDLLFTTPGSALLPHPGPSWDDSSTWLAPWDSAHGGGMAGVLWDGAVLMCDAWMKLDFYTDGEILTIETLVPDDGSYQSGDVLEVAASTAEFALEGVTAPVPSENREGDTLHIIPEPAALSLLALAGLALLPSRRRVPARR
jgi:hypothetical protein